MCFFCFLNKAIHSCPLSHVAMAPDRESLQEGPDLPGTLPLNHKQKCRVCPNNNHGERRLLSPNKAFARHKARAHPRGNKCCGGFVVVWRQCKKAAQMKGSPVSSRGFCLESFEGVRAYESFQGLRVDENLERLESLRVSKVLRG